MITSAIAKAAHSPAPVPPPPELEPDAPDAADCVAPAGVVFDGEAGIDEVAAALDLGADLAGPLPTMSVSGWSSSRLGRSLVSTETAVPALQGVSPPLTRVQLSPDTLITADG
jgi:hypothetical protein